MKSAKISIFKLSQIKESTNQGLIDSGATHPLRPIRADENPNDFKEVPVTLANGETTWLRMTPTGTMLTTNIGAEPIIPMAALIWKLGCDISWRQDELLIRHPRLGALPVKTKDGCPQVGK